MITARQIRAARALLGWSQQDLADKAILSLNTVARIEAEKVDPRASTLNALEVTLRKAGIQFLGTDTREEGVRLIATDRQ